MGRCFVKPVKNTNYLSTYFFILFFGFVNILTLWVGPPGASRPACGRGIDGPVPTRMGRAPVLGLIAVNKKRKTEIAFNL
jgi:hypothetical protein